MGRAFREIYHVIRGTSPTHLHLRERLGFLLILSVVVDLVASVPIMFVEMGAQGSQIHSYGDALFWTTGQLLTVSSNLANPISPAARVIDLILEFYAITVVATVAGSMGAFFHRRGMERQPLPPESVDRS
ncbi:hypothetical protein [Fodinicola feengrottensis]|uniref:Two pore domain potassium channel family protein n=2 Tax=Fodinicola feengrottensis TaxID=435914 RepID=A0ABP4V2W8_9ACTN|nr:hypothetical protein [Fodinicola feengrottensis]